MTVKRPHKRLRCVLEFDPLIRAFSNQCVFDENAQRISVDRGPKRIEMFKQQFFLSHGRQPEVDFLRHWAVVCLKLSG